jgi:selenocysteine lyase/cysteine desulfurase
VIVPAYYARDRLGATLKIVRVSTEDSETEVLARFEEAASPALRLILLSHVSYSTGQVFPIQDLTELAHSRGAYLLLDAAQSVGQMPVDVRELGCDFAAFPGHKWLLGPAATGALYVRRDLIEAIEPPNVSHHASAFYNFKDRFEHKSDSVDKFELTTASVPLLAGLNAAVEFVQSIGLDAIGARAVALAEYSTERLVKIAGVRMVSTEDASRVESGIVSFAVPGVEASVLTAHLWESANVVGRTVPDSACTRLCFHAFNTEAEADIAADLVAEAVKHDVPEGDHPSVQVERDAMVEL